MSRLAIFNAGNQPDLPPAQIDLCPCCKRPLDPDDAITADRRRGTVIHNGQCVRLTRMEFDLFAILRACKDGIEGENLIERVYGTVNHAVDENTLKVRISVTRHKLWKVGLNIKCTGYSRGAGRHGGQGHKGFYLLEKLP